MTVYTVVVLYPQHRPDAIGMTFTAHVECDNALEARGIGARQAQMSQPARDRRTLAEWLPLVVFQGRQIPVMYGWQTPACY